MPDRLNTDLLTPPRPLVAAADGNLLLTDAMLVDQEVSIPLIPLPSGDCTMLIEPPPRRVRGLKGKKGPNQNPSGHGRPGVARTILLFHTISVRPSKQPQIMEYVP